MRRLAFSALLIASMAFAACGGGDTPDDVDAAPEIDAAPAPVQCDPYAQTGCADGEKCTFMWANDQLQIGETVCVAAGNVPVGGACTFQSPPSQENPEAVPDDCEAGALCAFGSCAAICGVDPADTCGPDGFCNLYGNLFTDRDSTGICGPACDPIFQDCPEPFESCFLRGLDGRGSCGFTGEEAATKVQDEVCVEAQPGQCYIDGCAHGFGTFLIGWGGQGICMQYCTPAASGIGQDTEVAGVAPITCGYYDVSAELANSDCRFFNAVISDAAQNIEVGMETPDGIGMCMSQALRDGAGLGNCADHDLDAEPSQFNIDNGIYIVGCEPWTDFRQMNFKTGQWEIPKHIQRKQAEMQHKIQEYYAGQSFPQQSID